jgi:hypothetical protein
MTWDDAAERYHERTFEHDGRLSSLPADWQRELAALWRMSVDVWNGGYLQFLVNRGRETYAYASQALKKIGAHRMAEIIDSCQALVDEHFPSEGKSSDDLLQLLPNLCIGRDGRIIKEAGSVLPESVIARISELSYEFMDYPDNFGELAEKHYGPLIERDDPGLGKEAAGQRPPDDIAPPPSDPEKPE